MTVDAPFRWSGHAPFRRVTIWRGDFARAPSMWSLNMIARILERARRRR